MGLVIGVIALVTLNLHVGIPPADQTQIAEVARAAVGDGGLFGFFQLTSGLLLLAAASSFQAGPGLLKAVARTWNARRGRAPAEAARQDEQAPHARRGRGRRVRELPGRVPRDGTVSYRRAGDC